MDVAPRLAAHLIYEEQVLAVSRALRLALDYTFCSFERTLQKVLSLLAQAERSEPTEAWYHMGLFDAIAPGGDDSYWANVPGPDLGLAVDAAAAAAIPLTAIKDHVVWYCAVWRMQVTRVLERLVQPWHDAESQRWFLYRTQLFRDTHLDLLTMMVKARSFSDAALHRQQVLRTHWPTANRCCCAEELPDLSPYALDNFKMGAHLKERTTLHDKIGHYACIKTFNNICKDRNWWDIIRANGEQHPIVYDHIKLCVKTVLLGNLPGALGSLDLMARVRLNLSFWPEYADQELSEAEIARFMPDYCNPFVVARQKRAAKLAKETRKTQLTQAKREQNMAAFDAKEQAKMAYTKTRFKMWLIMCRYFASSLMKELMFYVQESGRCIDEYLSLDLKWIQYKKIIRLANGQCRLALSQQAATLPATAPFNWRQIEHIEKSPDGRYDLKSGVIMAFHNIALKVARKVMKRNFIGIVKIKATGIEEKIPLVNPLPRIYCDPSDGTPASKITLDELLFMGYCMASEDTLIPKTSHLQVLGMSRQGLATVREWMIEFHRYATPDDSYKKKILKYVRLSLEDYLILMTAIELIYFFRRREHVLVLPIDWALRQLLALRRQLGVPDWAPTPERMGVLLQCYGCQKFANAVVVPADYPVRSTYAEYTAQRHRVYCGLTPQQLAAAQHDQNVVLINEHKCAHTLEYHKDCFARLGLQQQVVKQQQQQPVLDKANKDKKKKQKRSDNISYLNIAAYDPVDSRAYCVRNKRKRITGPIAVPESEHNVIMRSRNREMTISCNKVATSIECVAGDDAEGTRRRGGDDDGSDSDDDDSDSDEGDETTRDDESVSVACEGARSSDAVVSDAATAASATVHVTRPEYEDDAALLTADIGSLSTRDLARVHRYAIQHTQDLIGAQQLAPNGRKAAVENNKKRIRRAVMEPLHRRYNCERPMQEVDMVGIVKNGMVLCVECGVMTQYRDYNGSPHGPTCMRHRCDSMMRSHPAWNQATASVQCSFDGSSGGASKKVHRFAVVPQHLRLQCQLCTQTRAQYYVATYDNAFKLQRLACCPACYAYVKTKATGGGKHQRPQVLSFIEVLLYRRALVSSTTTTK